MTCMKACVQNALNRAVKEAGIRKLATPHAWYNAIEASLLEEGRRFCTVQALLRHADLSTAMIYTHVLQQGPLVRVRSPLGRS